MSEISVIIAHRNDKSQLEDTIVSLGADCEIIVVDDDSQTDQKPDQHDWTSVRAHVIYSHERRGVGASRQLGAMVATGRILVFTDSHMRFPPGWQYDVIKAMDAFERQLFCSTYISDKPFNPDWYQGDEIHGADFHHIAFKPGAYNICHIEPRPAHNSELVPCVIGACYAIKQDYFKEIDGLHGLIGYGGDEQLLSWKVWLTGGMVRCVSDLRVIHKEQPYSKLTLEDRVNYLFNKLYVERMLMGDRMFMRFCQAIGPDILPTALSVLAAIPPAIDRKINPDYLSEGFGLQTIRHAIEATEQWARHKDRFPKTVESVKRAKGL